MSTLAFFRLALPRSPNSVRWLAHVLGYAGLIPFALLSALLWLVSGVPQAWVGAALASYAALVLAFTGGIHWGLVWLGDSGQGNAHRVGAPLDRPVQSAGLGALIWGVACVLLAWLGVLMPPSAGLAWLGFVLVFSYAVDRVLYARAGLQHWLTLRFRLCALAALSCFLGAAAL